MKRATVLGLLSWTMTFGFLIGLAVWIHRFWVHAYGHHHLFRLAFIELRSAVNAGILGSLLVLLGLGAPAIILRKTCRLAPHKTVLIFAVMSLLAVLIDHWMKNQFRLPLSAGCVLAGNWAAGFISGATSRTEAWDFLSQNGLLLALSVALVCVTLFFLVRWGDALYLRFLNHRLHRCVESPAAARVGMVVIVVFLGLHLSLAAYALVAPARGPNIIILGIDTFRADHLKCMGYSRDTMPHTEQRMSAATVFHRAYSTTSWTLPAFHSILTGLYPSSHGVDKYESSLDPSCMTLAELLKNQGYQTAGFISGPFLKSVFGFDQGFDVYDESASSLSSETSQLDITSPKLVRRILPWLEKHHRHPFFLFVHWWDPHYDYIPPEPYRDRFADGYRGRIDGTRITTYSSDPTLTEEELAHIVALYDAELFWTDLNLNELYEAMDRFDLSENTLLIIVGDHGEEFREHGRIGHHRTLYQEVIHVPLMVRTPGQDTRRDISDLVSIVDIMPSICEFLDIGVPEPIDGTSFFPASEELEVTKQDCVFAELHGTTNAIVTRTWSCILDSDSGALELYRLTDDPSESVNLAEAPGIDSDLPERLWRWFSEKQNRTSESAQAEIDEDMDERLRSLGYIQ